MVYFKVNFDGPQKSKKTNGFERLKKRFLLTFNGQMMAFFVLSKINEPDFSAGFLVLWFLYSGNNLGGLVSTILI